LFAAINRIAKLVGLAVTHVLSTVGAVRRWPEPVKDSGLLLLGA